MEIITEENGIRQGIKKITKDVSAYFYTCKKGTVQIAFCNNNIIEKNLAMENISSEVDKMRLLID